MTGVLAGPWDGSAIRATVRPPDAPVAVGVTAIVVVGAPVVVLVGPTVVAVRVGLAPHAVTKASTATGPRARTPAGYLALADAWLDTGPVPTGLVAATS